MRLGRASGVILHPTSLPGPYGIGELGAEAHAFVDFLHGSAQRVWQVLPLGPTGYGDSPYQCFSAFAGNPLLISVDSLVEEGLLTRADLEPLASFPEDKVDFGPVIDWKRPVLHRAAAAFQDGRGAALRPAFEAFCAEHAWWLDDYALFAVLKDAHQGRSWTEWAPDIRSRDKAALSRWQGEKLGEIEARRLWQFLFHRQWNALRARAHQAGIRIMGDIPIFVSHDSADVWARPELFRLTEDGRPEFVAGVPPDYFSATGQLWGNPLYRWDEMERTGFAWWIARFRATLATVDLVRVDHFRGFDAYYEIAGDAENAIVGQWVRAPGAKLFEALQEALGEMPIVAENLGVITPEVEALRERFSLPGMAILQFAFGADPQGSSFIPHNYPREVVAYTGTHDNDTTLGWWTAGVGDTTRREEDVERERAFALEYLKSDGSEIHWDFIRAVQASVADLAIAPLQDVLGLGSEARMNLPGRAAGNWGWRYRKDALTPEITGRLRTLTDVYGRARRHGG